MEIAVQNQEEYDEAVKNEPDEGSELVLRNCKEFIAVFAATGGGERAARAGRGD